MIEENDMQNLFCVDSGARLQSFDKLCRREKTTEIVSENETKMIRRFIYLNVNESDQGFRQRFLTCVKYLLIQLKESGYAISSIIARKDDPDQDQLDLDDLEGVLKRYENLIHWLVNFCFYCFRLRGNYARRASALRILELIYCYPILKEQLRNFYIQTWKLDEFWTPDNVGVLVECLADPYESNQALALTILKTVPVACYGFVDWPSLLKTAFDWSSATKTQYPEIAVYYLLLGVSKIDLIPLMPEDVDEICNAPNGSWSLQNRNCLALAHRLLAMLRRRTNAAEEDLIRTAMEGPPWGLLKCLLYVLKEVDWPFMLPDEEARSLWRPIIDSLLAVCHRLTKIVAPIVNSISPEGYLPMDMVPIDSKFLNSRDQDIVINDDSADSDVKFERWHHATCQSVLVCSWRTQKEVSALFGFLASLQQPHSLLEFEQQRLVGEYFLVQLTECKHRGAFECAYAAFVDVCAAAWKAPCERTKDLPTTWLRRIVNGVVAIADGRHGDAGFSYCVTRRSAGVPFLVQAVLATEPRRKDGVGSAVLYETLHKLLRILFEEESGDSEDKATAKVHSLNILRALVKESKLGVACLTPPWLSLIAQASLLAFTHRSWAVRNSTTLLFSGWMVRVFGVPRSRDEISMKNRMSATDFDTLCPDLLNFMLDQLSLYSKKTSQGSTMPFQEMVLFPVLTILARLYPSSSSSSVLRLFVPYVVDILLNCRVITVRRSAATALRSVMECNAMTELVKRFVRMLVADGRHLSQNTVHGMLLLIEQTVGIAREEPLNPHEDLPAIVARLAPMNSACFIRVIASQNAMVVTAPSPSGAETISRMFATLSASKCNAATAYRPFALLALLWTTKDDQFYDQLLACCNADAQFRRAVYKQWRSRFKKHVEDREWLIGLAKRLYQTGMVWNDVVDESGDLKLRIQACKLCLHLPQPIEDRDQYQYRAKTLKAFQLSETTEEALLQRRLFELACHYFVPNSAATTASDDLGSALMRKLDAASRPTRSLDDRLMAVDCLKRLNLKSNVNKILVVLIRLLSDLEDVVRDEATALMSMRFSSTRLSESPAPMQTSFAVFDCVVRLLREKDGVSALCGYLSEIIEELEKTQEDNAADERVFDKSEANYNLEPLLLTEWLRILASERKRLKVEP